MIDDAIMAARLDRLTTAIAASGIDAAAIVPGANFYFLTGANFHLMERPTVLFVTRDGARHAEPFRRPDRRGRLLRRLSVPGEEG